ncbi:MAG TPA: hypothetical protein PKW41_07235, partial [Clostridia bacterium]|nr:hypothetical protein [Clostridia bacterium]
CARSDPYTPPEQKFCFPVHAYTIQDGLYDKKDLQGADGIFFRPSRRYCTIFLWFFASIAVKTDEKSRPAFRRTAAPIR